MRPSTRTLLMRTGVLAGFADACREHRLEAETLVREQGLPREVLTDPNLYVRREAIAELLNAAARRTGRESFAMDLVDRQKRTVMGALAYLPFQGATIREGIELTAQCLSYHVQGIHHDLRDLGDGTSVLETEFGLPAESGFRQAAEMSHWRTETFLRALLGEAHQPVEYWSAYPSPADPSRYMARFEAPIRWNQRRAGHVLPTQSLEGPPQKQLGMKSFLIDHIQGTAQASPAADDPADEIRSIIRSFIGEARPTLQTVSAAAGIHPRDLQRQLSELDSSFSDIRDSVHRDYACEALVEEGVSITVLALELGYSESSAFSRAFKQWTGSSPSTWRRNALNG